MDKIILEKYLNDGMSINQISKVTGKSFTATLYWVNKFKLKSLHMKFSEKKYGEYRVCPRCGDNLEISNFYERRDKSGSSSHCKKCTRNKVLERVRKFKSTLIEYKGGKCEMCGYNKYQGALEFHHIDPQKKDFNLSRMKLTIFDEKVKNELDKCILVCSNCHREIHNDIITEKYL